MHQPPAPKAQRSEEQNPTSSCSKPPRSMVLYPCVTTWDGRESRAVNHTLTSGPECWFAANSVPTTTLTTTRRTNLAPPDPHPWTRVGQQELLHVGGLQPLLVTQVPLHLTKNEDSFVSNRNVRGHVVTRACQLGLSASSATTTPIL
mmetsp:Transcript_16200/g.31207  ORF Transcript_16200/g.31207 Transcript_16200/m.31207 type:complete len:147 (-) Transcript_16200:1883-2323(-)